MEATDGFGSIHRLALPTPFAIGIVNVYLIEDGPLTLIDCGPDSASVLGVLERLLHERGHALADLELLLVTHQHLDHCGLARALVERTDVRVACIEPLAPYLEHWERESERDDDHAEALMIRHGVEPHVAQALRAMANLIRGWGAAAPVHTRLQDGQALRLGDRELTVHARPGHSPSDTIFCDLDRRVMVGGDHLLARVSSNATVSRPLGHADSQERTRPLLDYRRSLLATRALGIDVVLPGHGRPVTDHVALIDARLREQDERAERLLEILRERPRTAHELAVAVWGEVAIAQVYLTLSEVLGHLDLLIDRASVAEDDGQAVVRFEAI